MPIAVRPSPALTGSSESPLLSQSHHWAGKPSPPFLTSKSGSQAKSSISEWSVRRQS